MTKSPKSCIIHRLFQKKILKRKNITSTVLAAFIGIAISGATFYVEKRTAESFSTSSTKTSVISLSEGKPEFKTSENNWQTIPPNHILESGNSYKTDNNSRLELNIFRDNVIRLNTDTEIQVSFTNQSPHEILIQVQTGEIWVNSQFSSDTINVVHPGINLIPHKSIFSAQFTENQTLAFNHIEETTVAFTEPQTPQNQVLTRTDTDQFINSFLLVGGRQATLFKNKINLKIAPLLYSKLVKEFNYARTNYDSLDQEWITWNSDLDQQFQDSLTNSEIERIKKRGLTHQSLQLEPTLLEKTEDIFTISEKKETERQLNRAFAHIDDIKLLLIQDQINQVPFRVKEFEKEIAKLQIKPNTKQTIEKLLAQEYSTLRSITPLDTLYPAKQTIFDAYFATLLKSNNQLETAYLLRSRLHEAFRTVPVNETKAKELLKSYRENLIEFLNKYQSTLPEIEFLLAEDNQIMAQLISVYPSLYTDEIFEIKSILEDAWIKLLPDNPDLKEEKQTLILQKINLLKKLQFYLFEEQVKVSDTKAVVLRLTEEIDSLLDTDSQVAIQQIFNQELADFNTFWRYLNSPEYSSPTASGIHGNTHKQRYEKFLKVLEENQEVAEISSELLGSNDPQNISQTQELTTEINDDLESAGLSSITTSALSTEEPTIEIINSTTRNKSFTATYNWQTKTLSNMTFDGTPIPDTSTKVGNLKTFLTTFEETQNLDNQNSQTSTEPSTSTETKLERTAKNLIQQKLSDNGIDAPTSQIEIIELQSADFAINKLIYSEQPPVTIIFNYNSKNNIVSNIFVETSFGTFNIPSQINIGEADFAETIEQQILALQ